MCDTRSDLLGVAPPPSSPVDAGTPEQWVEIERSLGTPLPSDYKWLINKYGSGDFCDLLVVLNPFSKSEGMNLQAQLGPTLERYLESRDVFTDECVFPVYPEVGGLFPVAQDTNGDDLFWVTHGHPDIWSLVHFNWRGGCIRQEYEMPLVDFLAGWVSGRRPDSFFGVGNETGIIKRDPVFCPLGRKRPFTVE